MAEEMKIARRNRRKERLSYDVALCVRRWYCRRQCGAEMSSFVHERAHTRNRLMQRGPPVMQV